MRTWWNRSRTSRGRGPLEFQAAQEIGLGLVRGGQEPAARHRLSGQLLTELTQLDEAGVGVVREVPLGEGGIAQELRVTGPEELEVGAGGALVHRALPGPGDRRPGCLGRARARGSYQRPKAPRRTVIRPLTSFMRVQCAQRIHAWIGPFETPPRRAVPTRATGPRLGSPEAKDKGSGSYRSAAFRPSSWALATRHGIKAHTAP